MAYRMRIISHTFQLFRANKTTANTLLEKCDIILVQETLLSCFNGKELDGILQNIEISCHTPANLSTSLIGGRPFEVFANFWKSEDNISYFLLFLTERIMGLALETTSLKYALVNGYLPYEQSTTQCLLDNKSSL